MALIKCPECGKKISNKAKQCIHCGYPLNEIENEPKAEAENDREICTINGKTFDFTELVNDTVNGNYNDQEYRNGLYLRVYKSVGMISVNDATYIVDYIQKNGKAPETFNSRTPRSAIPSVPPQVRCPKCGSTQITAGARGVNVVWGFIGASKTVNRCMNCGHTWKPGKL